MKMVQPSAWHVVRVQYIVIITVFSSPCIGPVHILLDLYLNISFGEC